MFQKIKLALLFVIVVLLLSSCVRDESKVLVPDSQIMIASHKDDESDSFEEELEGERGISPITAAIDDENFEEYFGFEQKDEIENAEIAINSAEISSRNENMNNAIENTIVSSDEENLPLQVETSDFFAPITLSIVMAGIAVIAIGISATKKIRIGAIAK